MRKSKLQRLRYGWFFDISCAMRVERMEIGTSYNSGDYQHHHFIGPYPTAFGAWREGMKLLRSELAVTQRRLDSFKLKRPVRK